MLPPGKGGIAPGPMRKSCLPAPMAGGTEKGPSVTCGLKLLSEESGKGVSAGAPFVRCAGSIDGA